MLVRGRDHIRQRVCSARQEAGGGCRAHTGGQSAADLRLVVGTSGAAGSSKSYWKPMRPGWKAMKASVGGASNRMPYTALPRGVAKAGPWQGQNCQCMHAVRGVQQWRAGGGSRAVLGGYRLCCRESCIAARLSAAVYLLGRLGFGLDLLGCGGRLLDLLLLDLHLMRCVSQGAFWDPRRDSTDLGAPW